MRNSFAGGHPRLFPVGLTLAALVQRWLQTDVSPTRFNAPLRTLFWLGWGATATLAALYALVPGYWDHLEASLAMRAIMIAQGAPAYPGVDAALRTQLVYGPVALLIPAWIAANVAPSAAALKAAVVVMGLVAVSLPLAWSGLRKTAPSAASLAPLRVMGSLLLFRQIAFRHVCQRRPKI